MWWRYKACHTVGDVIKFLSNVIVLDDNVMTLLSTRLKLKCNSEQLKSRKKYVMLRPADYKRMKL